jgi:predicted nucleotide-binding protein
VSNLFAVTRRLAIQNVRWVDLTTSRDEHKPSPRDNVLLELGLFLGRLGRQQTFIVYDRSANLKLPSDLAGVTLADFEMHSSGNAQASVGAACTKIEQGAFPECGQAAVRRGTAVL